MKERNYYWLLINKDQREINANLKWERDLLPEIIYYSLLLHHVHVGLTNSMVNTLFIQELTYNINDCIVEY